MSPLRSYPPGTKVTIGDRTFRKVEIGTFWREDLGDLADRVTELPAVTLEALENYGNVQHKVLLIQPSL